MKQITGQIFLIIFFALFFSCSTNAETIRIAFFEMEPYQYPDKDGNPTGFIPEMADEILKKMNLEYTASFMPYARGQIMIKEGKIDLLFAGSNTESRREFALYPEKGAYFLETYWGFLIQKKNAGTLKFDDFSDLKGKRIGSVRGYYFPQDLLTYMEGNASIEYIKGEAGNYTKLLKGRLDYIYTEHGLPAYYSKNLNFPVDDVAFLSNRLVVTATLYPLISKIKYQNRPEFVKKLTDTINEFNASDKKKELVKKWGIVKLDYDYTKVKWVYLP